MYTLLAMYEHHPDRYPAFVRWLREASPLLARQVFRWPRFHRKRFTLWLRRVNAKLFRPKPAAGAA